MDEHIGRILNNQEQAFKRDDNRNKQLDTIIKQLSSTPNLQTPLVNMPQFPAPYQHIMPTPYNHPTANWDEGEHYTPTTFNNNPTYYPQSDCGLQSVSDYELNCHNKDGSDDTITQNYTDNEYEEQLYMEDSSSNSNNLQGHSNSLSGLTSKLNPFGRR